MVCDPLELLTITWNRKSKPKSDGSDKVRSPVILYTTGLANIELQFVILIIFYI